MGEAESSIRWDPDRYQRAGGFVPRLGRGVVELLAPRPGERILDLGCGDGSLTEQLVASGAEVVGADVSPEMVAAARLRGIDARVEDAARLPFVDEFDAVFSNAALHWMQPLDDVLAGVRRALRTGGRFVAECGGHGNVAAITVAVAAALATRGVDAYARSPWYFPTPAAMRQRLERHGLRVVQLDHFARPTRLDTPMDEWLRFFARPFFAGIEEPERGDLLQDVVALLAPCLRDETGAWTADYVRLRYVATVP